MLAQVFQTSHGPLFVAPIVGRYQDWGMDEATASQGEALAGPAETEEQSETTLWPVPAELTCVLLGEDDLPPLRVKCREHGLFEIDLGRLLVAYRQVQTERGRLVNDLSNAEGSLTPVEVHLQDVSVVPG